MARDVLTFRRRIEEVHDSGPLAVPAGPFPFLLESSLAWPGAGRFDFAGADPFLTVAAWPDRIEIAEAGRVAIFHGADPLSALEEALGRFRIEGDAAPFPFAGGAVGFLSYDLAPVIEEVPLPPVDDLRWPLLHFAFYDRIDARDRETGRRVRIVLECPGGPPPRAAADDPTWPLPAGAPPADSRSNFSRDDYLAAVVTIREHIRRGDIYQANLSQRFSVPRFDDAELVYARLRAAAPAPFGAFLGYGDRAILSASPERFLQVGPACPGEVERRSRVETRPIKGTRPRGADASRDDALRRELEASGKDRAELAMIVDLERNDLGRVCEFGSVVVREARRIESYPSVHHGAAVVDGRLRAGVGIAELLRATFPGGSITGAPKIRALQILAGLEPTRRGPYTGAIGWIGFDGALDLAMAIRVALLTPGRADVPAGGGIVWDSRPEDEYEETLVKAKALLDVLKAPGIPKSEMRSLKQTESVR